MLHAFLLKTHYSPRAQPSPTFLPSLWELFTCVLGALLQSASSCSLGFQVLHWDPFSSRHTHLLGNCTHSHCLVTICVLMPPISILGSGGLQHPSRNIYCSSHQEVGLISPAAASGCPWDLLWRTESRRVMLCQF